MRLVLVLCLGLVLPCCLSAGPWPREKGTHFLSVTAEFWESAIPELPHYHGSIFYEFGLTDRLTLGTQAEMGSEAGSAFDLRLGIALVRERPYVLSLELAAGMRDIYRYLLVQDPTLPPEMRASFGRVGLAYGRGFSLGDHGGWFGTEFSAIAPLEAPEPALGLGGRSWKWDSTLGLRLQNDWLVLGQVFALHTAQGDTFVKLAPGVAIPIGERNHIEIGLRFPNIDPDSRALALGLWREF